MATLAVPMPTPLRAPWRPAVAALALTGEALGRREEARSMAERSDLEIILECKKGREDAFHELVERYQRRVLSIGYQMTSNFEAARDIAQEAFLRVFKAIERFDTQKNFYTWLYQIVTNLAIDHLRKERGKKVQALDDTPELVDGDDEPADLASRNETRVRVRQVLDKLPAKYRTVLTLRDLQGLGGEEIAEIIGTNHATARWRLHRARQLFKEIWEGKATQVVDDAEER